VVWKLDRLGRNLKHLVSLMDDLRQRQVGFKVLTGSGAQIDTTTANGRLVFGIFATLAEFESELIRERTQAGLASARVRGRLGGRPRKLTQETLHMAMAAMADPKSNAREGPAGGNVRPSAIRAWRFPFYHTALALSLYLSRFQVHWRPKSGETMPVHAEVGNPRSN
jgi:hypothetical protein